MVANPKVIENETALVPYSLEAAVIEGLKVKYLDVTIPADDRSAYAMVMSGLRECREIRLAVDAWHRDKKAWIVQAGKHYDSERRRVHALVEPIESHLAAVRKVEDDRKEAIKAEAERKERERVEKIRAKIARINLKAVDTINMTSEQIQNVYDGLIDWPITEEEFQEFAPEAMKVHAESLNALAQARNSREKWEQEQVAARAEAERLDKVRREQEAIAKQIKADLDAIEAGQKALEDAKRKEQERVEREALEKKLAEEARIKADADAKAKAEREAKEAELKAQREAEEAARKEKLKPDKEKLLDWIKSFNDTNIPVPRLKHKAPKEIYRIAMEEIEIILQDAQEKAEAL